MTGMVLQCDGEGCEARFPEAPHRGRFWPIREAAKEAGWQTSHKEDKDYCPEHSP